MSITPHPQRYCRLTTDCIRAWVHTGECLYGCRICFTADHLTKDCPSWNQPFVYAREDFPADDTTEENPE